MRQVIRLCSAGFCCSILALAAGFHGAARAFEFNQENSCVLLNNSNTDILNTPSDCSLPENQSWCNCTRTALTNPIRGQATVFEQGVMWLRGQDGIGNHRVEVDSGTLDLSGIDVGEVIGASKTDEIIPGSGQNFKVLSEIRATGKNGNAVEFDFVITLVSPFGLQILGYNPFDCNHSCGLLYRGRLISNGPGAGFVFEYRYEKNEESCTPVAADPPHAQCAPGTTPFHAAIEASDAVSPGFNVRFAISVFTDGASGAYTLPPSAKSIHVDSTLRRFTESGDVPAAGEILPLGEPDLCVELSRPDSCRLFSEDLAISSSTGPNNPPVADVVATDVTGGLLFDDIIFIDCGVGRVVLRGSNSTDGDGGTQGLSFLWEIVAGPKAGAAITSESATFMDVDLSVFFPGDYTIRLTVNDGQAENNTDTAEVVIRGQDGLGPNLPPEITSLTYRPDGNAEVELLGGDLRIELQLVGATATLIDLDADGNAGADGCQQLLLTTWTRVSGPADVIFSDPLDDDTDVTFMLLGEYVIRLTTDDLAPEDNITTTDVTVVLTPPGVGPFKRGDCNQDGTNTGQVTDGVFLLTFLFQGGAAPKCRAACDFDGDGAVPGSPTDAVYYFNFNFLGGPEMPPPLRECARSSDPEDIALGCEDPQGCP